MKVFTFTDCHFPFQNKEVMKNIYKAIKAEKPDVIVNTGDLYDQYMFSKYSKDLDLISPEVEIKLARKEALKMWAKIKKLCPRAKCYQMLGNHDIRMIKKIKANLPEALSILIEFYKDLYEFPGVTSSDSDRDYLVFDDVVYCHGWMGSHTAHFCKSVVRGHSHKAEITYKMGVKTGYKPIFEVQAGCCADETAIPMDYPASKKTGWKAGYVMVIDGHPYLEVL